MRRVGTMPKTNTGSCHCGRARFEVNLERVNPESMPIRCIYGSKLP